MKTNICSAVAGTILAIAFVFTPQALSQTKPSSVKKPSAPKIVSEISDKDWGALAGALSREEWDNSVKLSTDLLAHLGTENEKKQLAQLRYLHIFSLAGRLNSLITGKNASAIEPARTDLSAATVRFTGQEMVMPLRSFAILCKGKVNFVCPVKDNASALRITATNKDGDAILSFDYVMFDDTVNLADLDGRKVFLGGTLDRAEFNDNASKPWIMRLFFKKGFARISVGP